MNQQPALSVKHFIIAAVILCPVSIFCVFILATIPEEVKMAGQVMLVLFVLVVILGILYFFRGVNERVLTLRANRKQAENEAAVKIITAPEGHQIIAQSLQSEETLCFQPLHLDARRYINGKATDPLEFEIQAWQLNQQLRRGTTKIVEPAGLLPEPSLDLLTVFSQPMQAYATIGGQQTGKTYQNQHIASSWVQQGTIPYVIATKWDIGEWPGCKLLGGNADWGKVERGLALIQEKATERHDSESYHKSHPILPVFIDDWTPTVNHVKSATDLILNATTMFASVNMILYFIIHSDTANAWGVGKKGAALKNNFVKLFIKPQRDLNGSLIFSQSKGEIIFPGESDVHPVQLINSPVVQSSMVIEANAEKPMPTTRETGILEMWDNEESYRQITTKAYDGQFGDYYNRRVDAVLKKFGRI